jgi:hypothetical protein
MAEQTKTVRITWAVTLSEAEQNTLLSLLDIGEFIIEDKRIESSLRGLGLIRFRFDFSDGPWECKLTEVGYQVARQLQGANDV